MKIEVWSDFVCPFCYIGKRRLEEALQQAGFSSQAEVEFKSFELDPNTPKVSDKSIYEELAGKYGTTVEAAKQMTEGVAEQARTVGLEYNFDTMKPANTLDAHRLVKWASDQGKAKEANELLLHSYFIESKEIGKHDILLDLIESIGLSREEADKVLNSDAYLTEVQADIARAGQIGVRGVPFFVLNDKYAISGAQPLESFVGALNKVAEEEGISPTK
ncbi:DsbA family oxidoreductase [Psychrobacillus vulpis]|uniref:DsbA family oxidoreductase n=1 Tax=Psychrobacillus vulpis TaxID=2325572 RepID=A0A544TVN8_9BACI|nr:DsbA family oxidoreductase [Psychrobacillus vulpis]TQR21513.1 DsbA family oxidoreductase [Psychrobacillus vulpis]